MLGKVLNKGKRRCIYCGTILDENNKNNPCDGIHVYSPDDCCCSKCDNLVRFNRSFKNIIDNPQDIDARLNDMAQIVEYMREHSDELLTHYVAVKAQKS